MHTLLASRPRRGARSERALRPTSDVVSPGVSVYDSTTPTTSGRN